MAVTIQHRRDTAANWTSVNPVLYSGQLGFETNTLQYKLGNGSTAWNSLPYISGSAGDVRRYGVIGNGVADDTAAITAAIAANPGGVLDFGSLNCKTTSTITVPIAAGAMAFIGANASIVKHHTGDLLVVNAGTFMINGIELTSAYTVSTSYATSGRGLYIWNNGATTPNFKADQLTVSYIDTGGVVFGIDAGSGSHVTNYTYTPYTTTYGSEGKAIITANDTAARPRFFTNINAGAGIIQTGGSKDNCYESVFCRRIEHSVNEQVNSYVGVRYGNLGNAITLDGNTCHWSCCSFSAGPLTLASTMNGCTVEGTVSSGSIVDNTTQGACLVDLWSNSLRYTGNALTRTDLVVTVNGDAALSMSITSRRQQVWDSPLTANRNCNLPSTSLFNGHEIHVVRTAASTGAFNLNVNGNGGLLKALGIGTWCRAVCDGTTWHLSAYGAL